MPDVGMIHLTEGDGPALCSIPAPDARTITVAEWETGVDAATGARICRDCADAHRRLHAE